MAMVPSSANPHQVATPQFPSCLNWVLNNQLKDGSWGLCDRDTTLTMDALSSTLACVLALKQWGTGERQINRGLEFIATNSAFVINNKQHKPIGFDIIFPGMIDRAKSMNLNIPVSQADLDDLLHRRKLELARSSMDFTKGRRAYLSYISEGVGISQDWEMAMKYQRKNGSLFNSPSTTAAAFSHLDNADCLRYLNLLLDTFGGSVPAVYPLEIYTRLQMVDNLKKLGIHHYFKEEIEIVCEDTYRCWLQGDEEIFEDTTTCAMAFRILRLHGYDVSSDALSQFADEGRFRDTLEGYLGETSTVLELHKASQIVIYEDEVVLEKINSWTGCFLRDKQLGYLKHPEEGLLDKCLSKEVDYALRFPYHADVERLANRRNIEHYNDNIDNTRMLKSAERSCAIGNKDFLNLAVEDLNKLQLIHQKELKDLERWVVEKRLDKLKFARQKQVYCYLMAAVITPPMPELSDARLSFAKNAVLVTVIDDLFDVGGSQEELENLIQLIINRTNVDVSKDCCSENVEILYSALDSTISETSEKAFAWQGRCVTHHLTELWFDVLKSMLKEVEWCRKKLVPTMHEYMANGITSNAMGPSVLVTIYFMGQISEDAIRSPPIQIPFELLNICARLLNDVRSFKRESWKLDAVKLQMMIGGGEDKEEEAIKTIKSVVSSKTRELLRWYLLEGSRGSSNWKDLFWKMNTVVHHLYVDDDGFTSQSLADSVNTFLNQPIIVSGDEDGNSVQGARIQT